MCAKAWALGGTSVSMATLWELSRYLPLSIKGTMENLNQDSRAWFPNHYRSEWFGFFFKEKNLAGGFEPRTSRTAAERLNRSATEAVSYVYLE